jgi:hypothetical protein
MDHGIELKALWASDGGLQRRDIDGPLRAFFFEIVRLRGQVPFLASDT